MGLLELYNQKADDSANGGTPARVKAATSTDTQAGIGVDYFDGRPKAGADLFQVGFKERKRNEALAVVDSSTTDPGAGETKGRSQWLGRALLSAFTDPAGTGRSSQYTQFKTIAAANYTGPATLPAAGASFHNNTPSSTFIGSLTGATQTRAQTRTNPT